MRKPELLRRTPWRYTKDQLHNIQHMAARMYGRPLGGMLTDLRLDGRRVIFLHNPKAGGTSLGKFLKVKRRSHSRPKDVLNEKSWLNCISIVVVREPFERFLSSYYANVLRGRNNSLTKRYGQVIHDLDPFEFLELLKEVQNSAPQKNWTHFPSTQKPHADIILRFEDISNWKDNLLDMGLDVGDRQLEHHNKSERSRSSHLERLKLTPERFDDLRCKVIETYKDDYAAYGYNPHPC